MFDAALAGESRLGGADADGKVAGDRKAVRGLSLGRADRRLLAP